MTSRPDTPGTPRSTLPFHPSFSTKRPGDVILRAGDRPSQCFYFRQHLLSALSSFFATLPTPSAPSDSYDGIPLIPLHEATSPGLALFLHAILSTTTSEPLIYPRSIDYSPRTILESAVIGRTYDTPIIFRLLYECIQGIHQSDRDFYLEFAIFSIGNIRSRLPSAAALTMGVTAGDITDIDEEILDMCRTYAPDHWLNLQDLHLRRLQGPKRFKRKLRADKGELLIPFSYHNNSYTHPCEESIGVKEVPKKVAKLFENARTVEEIMGIAGEGKFGLDCSVCIKEAGQRYRSSLDWLDEFSSSFWMKP